MIVDGQIIKTKVEPFIYNGNVYAPVATIANALGIHQSWNNAVPGVHFDRTDSPKAIAQGMYITAFEDGRGRGGSGTSYQPLYNVVSLITSWQEHGLEPTTYQTTGVRDYSTDKTYHFKSFFSDWDTIQSASFVQGSARPDLSRGENLTDGEFSLVEFMKNGETRVSRYQLKDKKLTRIHSFQIQHDQGVHPEITGNGFNYSVRFYKAEKLIGVQDYIQQDGKWVVSNELFK